MTKEEELENADLIEKMALTIESLRTRKQKAESENEILKNEVKRHKITIRNMKREIRQLKGWKE